MPGAGRPQGDGVHTVLGFMALKGIYTVVRENWTLVDPAQQVQKPIFFCGFDQGCTGDSAGKRLQIM